MKLIRRLMNFVKNILYIYRDTSERKLVIVTDTNSFKIGINLNECFTIILNYVNSWYCN